MARESRFEKVEDVELEASLASREALRWFYEELLELDPDAAVQDDRRMAYRSGGIRLTIHLNSNPQTEPIDHRVTVRVNSLEEIVRQLEERRIGYERVSGLDHTDRLLSVLDPGGNRVALRQVWGGWL